MIPPVSKMAGGILLRYRNRIDFSTQDTPGCYFYARRLKTTVRHTVINCLVQTAHEKL